MNMPLRTPEQVAEAGRTFSAARRPLPDAQVKGIGVLEALAGHWPRGAAATTITAEATSACPRSSTTGYWARGKAGPYSVIASLITAHQNYGYEQLPIVMLARDGAVVADDSRAVRFEREVVYTDDLTGKPVANVTRYTYDAGDDRYVVTFTRERDLSRSRMIEGIHGPKRALARLARFDGAYLPFTGQAALRGTAMATLAKGSMTKRSGS